MRAHWSCMSQVEGFIVALWATMPTVLNATELTWTFISTLTPQSLVCSKLRAELCKVYEQSRCSLSAWLEGLLWINLLLVSGNAASQP